MMGLSFRGEVIRKSLHVGALALPLGIVLLPREIVLPALIALAVVAVTLDVLRHRWAPLHRIILMVFGPIMRPEEKPPLGGPIVINGATWMCVAAALSASIFPATVAAAALALVMVGDASAAIIGRRWGRIRYPASRKTVEGSLAFVVTGFLAAFLIAQFGDPRPGVLVILAGTFVGAVVEALPLPLNDNLQVALLSGIVMWILM